MIERDMLKEYAAGFGVTLDTAQLDAFDRYAALLVEWNAKMNLTAITEPQEIVIKHFVDSLSLLSLCPIPQGARLVDVGTGAGFPSVPLKIARPDLHLTLLDSLNKRITFLQELSQSLGQDNECIHARAEEVGRSPVYREKYDMAVSRAVARLYELSEYCLPFVRAGGIFAAYKGNDCDKECAEAGRAVHLLGGELKAVKRLGLPDGSGRAIVLIKKRSQTSTKYPRPHSKIAKNPLV